jgi:hypothetical protein
MAYDLSRHILKEGKRSFDRSMENNPQHHQLSGNSRQNLSEIAPHPSWNVCYHKDTDNKCWQGCEGRKNLANQ